MRTAILIFALVCAAGGTAHAEIQQDVINRDPSGGAAANDGDFIDFGDADGNFDADKIGPAIEELDDPNEVGPNAPDGKVNWEQLIDVPEGFADGTDDGGGGGGSVTVEEEDGNPSVSDVSTIQLNQGDGFTVTDEGVGQVQIGLSLGAEQVTYADTDNVYPTDTVGAAIEALRDTNESGPNATTGKVNWEQVMNMPEPFVDGGIAWSELTGVPEFRKTLVQLRPQGYEPPVSNFAFFNTRALTSHPILEFFGNLCAQWTFVMPNTYGGNGVTVDFWYVSIGTSGDTDWDGSWERIATSQDIDSDSYASAISSDNNNNNATSGIPTKVSIAFTDGAQMDSCAADELCRFRLCRDDASDTSGTNDIEWLGGQIRETP